MITLTIKIILTILFEKFPTFLNHISSVTQKGYRNQKITIKELEELLGKMKLGKTAGYDSITGKKKKYLNVEGKKEYLIILNQIRIHN